MPQTKSEKPSGPSLEETFQWLSKTLENFPLMVVARTGHTVRHKVIFGECDMTLVTEQGHQTTAKTQLYARDGELNFLYFRFKDIDFDRANVIPYYDYMDADGVQIVLLQFGAIGQRKVVSTYKAQYRKNFSDIDIVRKEIQGVKDPGIDNFQSNYVGIELPNMGIAERILNAMQHAASLCLKRGAQERAAQPAKPKELF